MKSAHLGVLAFLGFSLAWMGLAAHWLTRSPRSSVPANEHEMHANGVESEDDPAPSIVGATQTASANAVADARRREAETLVRRLVELMLDAHADDDELSRTEAALLALGEGAATPLITWLGTERDSALRTRLLDVLRKVPGPAAEAGLIDEAKSQRAAAGRALAMEALAERRTSSALAALAHVARTDPDLPRRPLITVPIDPNDTATELPDENLFTPRMQAMAALASTEDPRATPMLADVLRNEGEESLRMEAARDLARLKSDPNALDALARAASSDPSHYVRLAALHSLEGVENPDLLPTLTLIATKDSHAGVRSLANRISASLRAALPTIE